jgi:hypothetical protein
MTKESSSFRSQGCLEHERSGWFDGLSITPTTTGETIGSGPIADQAALHGGASKDRTSACHHLK